MVRPTRQRSTRRGDNLAREVPRGDWSTILPPQNKARKAANARLDKGRPRTVLLKRRHQFHPLPRRSRHLARNNRTRPLRVEIRNDGQQVRIVRANRIVRTGRTSVLQGPRTVLVRQTRGTGNLVIIHNGGYNKRQRADTAVLIRRVVRVHVYLVNVPDIATRSLQIGESNHNRLTPDIGTDVNIAPLIQTDRMRNKLVTMLPRRARRLNRHSPLVSTSRHHATFIYDKGRTRPLTRNRLTINKNRGRAQLISTHATNNDRRRVDQNRRGRNIGILLVRNITRVIRIKLHTRDLVRRRRTRRRSVFTNSEFSKNGNKGRAGRLRTTDSRASDAQATKNRNADKVKKAVSGLIGNNLRANAHNVERVQ